MTDEAAVPVPLIAKLARIVFYYWIPRADSLAWGGDVEGVLGHRVQELGCTTQGWVSRIHPDDVGRVLKEVDDVALLRRAFDVEYRMRHGDGSYRWILDRGAAFAGSEGGPDRIAGVLIDITARKESEESAARNTALLADLVEATTDSIFVKDMDGRYLLFNAGAGAVVGRPPGEVVGHDDFLLFPPEIAERVRQQDALVVAGRTPVTFEETVPTAAGERVFLTTKGPLLGRDGGPVAVYGVAKDITETRRAREETERAERRFRALVENAWDGVLVVGRDLRFLYVSPAASRLVGLSPEEMMGREPLDFVDPESLPAARQAIADALRQPGGSAKVTTRMRRADGSTFWVESALTNRVDDPAIGGLVVNFRDVTEDQRARQTQREHPRATLMAQEDERRRIGRELHDEIGQVLTAVKIDLQALLYPSPRRPVRHRVKHTIDVVDVALTRLRRLITELRPPALDDLGLVSALADHLDRLEAAGLATSLVVEGARTHPAEVETACFRVAQEALTNVLRHAQASRVEVKLVERGGMLELTVRDDGRGFEVGAVPKDALGLEGMRERATLLGGSVDVQSGPGAGTVVHASFATAGPP